MKHIAGPWITIGGNRVIQRCMACGFKLVDQRVEARIATFGWGSVVDVYGKQMKKLQVVGTLSKDDEELRVPLIENIDNIKGLCTEP